MLNKLLHNNQFTIKAITTCAASGCGGVAACVACVTGIAASCGACANDVCNNSKDINETFGISPRLTCQISASACDFHCRCRYNKRGTCSNGTCYCN